MVFENPVDAGANIALLVSKIEVKHVGPCRRRTNVELAGIIGADGIAREREWRETRDEQ
jgi:hypothetical protein